MKNNFVNESPYKLVMGYDWTKKEEEDLVNNKIRRFKKRWNTKYCKKK
tara:strand:- start:290 stop:433 length:144 start_codon:yes stop_codon:yes gene_type:complete